MTRFADHFSLRAVDYAAYRPMYPPSLIEYLAGLCPADDLAWDVGTGSGQAAVLLAAHFRRVVATDASAQQIDQAQNHPRVIYRVAMEDASGLEPVSVDLVTVAQALHWFDLPRFYREVRRVLRPGGAVAVWCYGHVRIDADVDPIVDVFYSQRVGPFWPPERRYVESGYRDTEFPFEEIPSDAWAMTMRLTQGRVPGIRWDLVVRRKGARGRESRSMADLANSLCRVWPNDDDRRTITWPVGLRVGRTSRPPASL